MNDFEISQGDNLRPCTKLYWPLRFSVEPVCLKFLTAGFCVFALQLGGLGLALAQEPAIQQSEVDRLLGPLKLVTPLSEDSIQVIMDEAESHYRRGNRTQAMAGFHTLVSLESQLAQAWLRIGNLYQSHGAEAQALQAYSQAGAIETVSKVESAAREKALFNVGLIYLEKVQRALERLEQVPALAHSGVVSEAAREAASDTAKIASLSRQQSLREAVQQTQQRLEAQQTRVLTKSSKVN